MVRLLLAILLSAASAASARAQVAGAEGWSFRPVLRAEPPRVTDAAWPANPIDHFVLARLEAAGLQPSRDADPAALVRRLSLIVCGLPPTPEEIETFVADDRADAYERLVDRLLASPRYGERWARHWLDIVGFAETHGFETNTPRGSAWPYRDWVIGAFNEDMPYDQFVLEQLAGDAAGVDAATGFLVAGPYDTVKSPDVVLTRNQRQDELADIVNTASTAFLGLTIACARCHDHKFDPITQRDYYALQAVFAGVQHGERPWRSLDDEAGPTADDYAARITAIRAELLVLGSGEADAAAGSALFRDPVNAQSNEDVFAPVRADRLRFEAFATRGGLEPCLDELEVYGRPDQADPAGRLAFATVRTSGDYQGNPKHRPEHLDDGLYGNDHSWISDTHGTGWVEVSFESPAWVERVVWGRDRDTVYSDRLATSYAVEVAIGDADWSVVSDGDDRLPPGVSAQDLAGLASGDEARARVLLAEWREAERAIADLEPLPRVYGGRFEPPVPTHLLYRGDPMQEREAVAPNVPAVLGTLGLAEDAPERERRLALARWLGDPERPLPARVAVNRLWMHHFGEGLVDTPSDFGAMGGVPTHPELLDWLASELVESGWSLKHVQRLILTSRTWRQSSEPRAAALGVDADGRLLWRFPPRRVEAEVLRDSLLAVAGTLDLTMGGPGFSVFEPNDNYVRVYTPRAEFGPDAWRRMVYMTKVRMERDATFGVFDTPDAGLVCAERSRSTTALQALNLLNSRFVTQQAEAFARRLEREVDAGRSARVRHAFQLAFGRAPEPAEAAAGDLLVEAHGLPALCRALFNANEIAFVQ